MRTLAEIDAEIAKQSKDHADKIWETGGVRNLFQLQVCEELTRSFKLRETFVKMHYILEKVDQYLKRPSLDGKQVRQQMRAEIKEALENL